MMPRARGSVTDPPLLVDNDAMGVCLVPLFDFCPAVPAVLVIIVAIVISGIAITISGVAKEREKSQRDMAAVVAAVRIRVRRHGNNAGADSCNGNK